MILGQGIRRRRDHGFTLVEVILAITIAIGILVVALYFYQQTSKLRSELLQEAERLAAIRLVMDRVTNDLRAALPQSQVPFFGDSTAMRFVKAELPSREFLSGLAREGAGAQTDLRKISYAVQFSPAATTRPIRGVSRLDEPLIEFQLRRDPTAAIPDPAALAAVSPFPPDPSTPTNSLPSSSSQKAEPVSDQIHYLHFSYWDGAAWSENWVGSGLPKGVEVTLSLESHPEALDPSDGSIEIFRRVILVPGAGREGNPGAPDSSSGPQASSSRLAEVAP